MARGSEIKINCAECGAELDPWDTVFSWENGWLCEDCFDGEVNALSRLELADMLGSQMLTAEEVNERY
jgi:hypothetical protein